MIFENIEAIDAIKYDFEALKKLWKKNRAARPNPKPFSAPLMVSAHQLKHLNKIDELRCDAIIINLEDGVSPEQKPMALHLAALFVTHLDQSDKMIIVRVNPLNENGDNEIKFLNQVGVDAIRVPKVRTKADVKKALKLIRTELDLHLSIETKDAWLNLSSLAVNKRVTAMYLGVLDLFAELDLSQELIAVDNPMFHYLLSHFLVTVRSLACLPVSFVYQEYTNLPMFEKWLSLEKSLGFTAKGVISPKQAELAMERFSISQKRLERAQYIVKRFEDEAGNGVTGFVDERYGFIDEPIYKGALQELKERKS